MANFYKTWIEKTFSQKVDVQSDEMVVRSGERFRILDTPVIMEDHVNRGEHIFHFYLTYFRPMWTDCTCEGYFAENFGMVWWQKSPKKDDIAFLMDKNCTKVSHEPLSRVSQTSQIQELQRTCTRDMGQASFCSIAI